MTNHVVLLNTLRNNIVDMSFWGSYYLAKSDDDIVSTGKNIDTISFMRSLAKPFQASIMFDYDIIKDFDIKEEELAIFSASHAGSEEHVELLENILKKHNLKEEDLILKESEPLDLRNYKGSKRKLYNNCSAKHIMMLLMCQYLGFDKKNYTSTNHPLQKLIQKKQEELTSYKSDYITYDGCGTPLWGLPIKNIIKGYFNLLNDKKYEKLFKSILNNSYIFGGYDRFDTEIINLSNKKLFSKVGAGGFVIVYNFELNQILLVKMAQNNNFQRKLVTLNLLNRLGWLNAEIEEFEYNQQNQKVAKYDYQNFIF